MFDLEENIRVNNEQIHKIEDIGNSINIESLEQELKALEKETEDQSFWNEAESSSKKLARITELKKKITQYANVKNEIETVKEMLELLSVEQDDEIEKEIQKSSEKIDKDLESLEIATLLSGKYDKNNAIITIHPGAGGTEAQDWAEMLYRMYTRWGTENGFKIEELDYLDGEEAGLKSVTFLVSGDYAYGYLKSEHGVHRLVRISPFDSGGRRHTSFASVEVLPEISNDADVYINPDDIKMDVYRASGAGGQHINKTSSAVRLIHIPTGMVAECQTERSQVQNREYAMRMLRSRLYEKEKQERDAKLANERKSQVGSGDRSEKIRTYNYPQGRITDHRIGLSIYQMEDFLNGNLDEMIDNLIAADRAEKLKGSEE